MHTILSNLKWFSTFIWCWKHKTTEKASGTNDGECSFTDDQKWRLRN